MSWGSSSELDLETSFSSLTNEIGILEDDEGDITFPQPSDFPYYSSNNNTNCTWNWNETYSMQINGTYSCADYNDSYFPMLRNDPVSVWIRLMVLLLYGVVCIVGLCGNSLVIYVVLRFSKMQTVTNLYIVNLAIADECFLVGIPFLMATTALEYWPFGAIMCKVYFISTSVNQVTSSMFLLIMSADRFLAVCHPITSTKWRTPFIASVVALTAWALSALIMVPIFMYANTLQIGDKISCNIYWPNGWLHGDATFMIYSFLVGFTIPMTLISIFYILVILRLQHVGPKRPSLLPVPSSNNTSSGHPNSTITAANVSSTFSTDVKDSALNQQATRARDRKKSHRKVTKLVLTVITVFFLCWAPYWATQLTLIFSMDHEQHSPALLTIFLLAGCLSYSNSAMNPILYAFLSDNFKKSFLKACSCANRREINAALQPENSMFPKNKKQKNFDKKYKGSGHPMGSSSRMINSSSCNPPKIVTEAIDEEDGFLESDDEGAAILGCNNENSRSDNAFTSRSAISEISKVTQDTMVHDGVHVTAL